MGVSSSVTTFDARTLVHEAAFDQAAAAIFGSPEKADDALAGALLTIAREPQRSVAVIGGGRALKTEASAHWPSVVIVFIYDAQRVTLLSAFKADPNGR